MSALLSVALTPKLIAPLPGKRIYYIAENVLFQMCFFPFSLVNCMYVGYTPPTSREKFIL